jgi:hypothetical protein
MTVDAGVRTLLNEARDPSTLPRTKTLNGCWTQEYQDEPIYL